MAANVIMRDKPSVIPIIAIWIILFVFFLVVDLIVLQFFKSIAFLYSLWIVLTVFMLLLITLQSIIDLVAREFHVITLTQTQLIREHGIFNRAHDMIPLDKVQTVHIRYPLAGQILDYGNLIVTTAGSGVKIRNLPHPQRWELQILKRIRKTS